ncbi:MAG: TMEM143 family protein [Aquihabitans sp.]
MATRERFVPRRVSELTDELAEMPWTADGDPEDFRAFSRLMAALFHFEFYDREQRLLDVWEEASEDANAASLVAEELDGLLTDSNYTPVAHDDLHEAIARETTIPLRLEVDLDDYEVLLIERRGSRQQTIDTSRFRGLMKRERTITVEDRVVVFSKVQSADHFESRGIDPASLNLVPGQVMLKQFQHVPRADIEMLLPSTKVRYRRIDTIMVGLPAIASGLVVLATKLLPTIGLMALLAGTWLGLSSEQPKIDQAALVVLFGGLAAIGGFFVRQWTKLKNRRVAYLKMLSEVLYFRTLSTGPGVLHTLLVTAERQEVIETLLAYRFLLEHPDGISASDLDEEIEVWLRGSCQREIDFDVDDALDKVRRLGLVHGDARVSARPLSEVLYQLDQRWNALFDHRSRRPEHSTVIAGR